MPLRPDLLTNLYAAYDRNVASGLVTPKTTHSLGDLAAAAAAQFDATDAGRERAKATNSLEVITTNPEVKAAFERAFTGSAILYDRIHLTAPTLDQLLDKAPNSDGGPINLEFLANEYERMQAEGLKLQVVLAPRSMTRQQARGLFAAMTPERDDKGVITNNPPGMPANNPLKQQTDGNGLWMSSRIPDELFWEATNDPSQWTLRIIPTTPVPQELEKTHQAHTNEGKSHPRIAEYLTLQGTRLQAGTESIDKDTAPNGFIYSTWLDNRSKNGQPVNGAHAPYARWFAGSGRVGVGWSEVGLSSVVLGVRSPVG